MRIFAISVVKNEADVIESNLEAASVWVEKIFVLDNGSTDGTWEKVLSMANDTIIPWKQDLKPFRDSVRSEVYNHFKHLSMPGDWWCVRLDGDEFYPEDPRKFLKAVPSGFHYVCAKFVQFRISHEDILDFEYVGDFKVDKKNINYLEKSCWVEARFVRFRKGMVWNPDSPFPRHMGIVYPVPIDMFHYQYRSPRQIQMRLDVRHAAKALGHHSPHVKVTDWKETLVPRAALYNIQEKGVIATLPIDKNYLHKPYVYFLKKLLHGLRILP